MNATNAHLQHAHNQATKAGVPRITPALAPSNNVKASRSDYLNGAKVVRVRPPVGGTSGECTCELCQPTFLNGPTRFEEGDGEEWKG